MLEIAGLSEVLRNILSGYAWLATVEALNGFAPLLLIPFLTRKLGLDIYGHTVFAMAILAYIVMVCDFGFSLQGVTRIAKAEFVERRLILANVTTLKFSLASIGFILASVAAILFTRSHDTMMIHIGTYLGVFGAGLYPIWFLQGEGRVMEGALVLLAARMGYLGLTLATVHGPQDAVWVNFSYAISSIIASVIAYAFIFRRYGWYRVDWRVVASEAWLAFPVFITFLGTSFYRNANTLIVGALANPAAVANYSVAEKLVKATQGLLNPLAQSFFPHHARSIATGDRSSKTHHRALCIFIVLLCGASLGLMTIAPFLLQAMTGIQDPSQVLNLRILSAVIVIGGGTYWLGLIRLLSHGRSKDFAFLTNSMGVFSLIAATLLVPFWNARGAVAAMVVSEAGLLGLMLWRTRRREA